MFQVLTLFVALLGQVPENAGRGLGSHQTLRIKAGNRFIQPVRAMTFSPDGNTLVVSLTDDKTIFVRTQDAEIVDSYMSKPFALAYTKDGSRILLLSESETVFLDAKTHTRIPFTEAPSVGYCGLTLLERNGKLNVSVIAPNSPVAKLGSIHVGDELTGVGDGLRGPVQSVIGSTAIQTKKLLTGPVGTSVRLKVIPRGQTRAQTYTIIRQAVRIEGTQVEFLPLPTVVADDNIIFHMDRQQRHILRSAGTGQVIASVIPEEIASVGQYAVSPDGSRFAIIAKRRDKDDQSAIEIYRVDTGKRESFVPFKGDNWQQLSFSADSSKLLVGTSRTLEILDVAKQTFDTPWDLAPKALPAKEEEKTSNELTKFGLLPSRLPKSRPQAVLARLAVSPKGLIAVGEMSGAVQLCNWNSSGLLQLIEPEEGANNPVGIMEFSADGRYLAYYTSDTLHLVDVSRVLPKASPKP